MACPGLEVQAVLCKPRKSEPRFGGPIPLDTTGRPDFKRPGVGEEIAIAKAQAIGEPAARGQRAELWMEALAVEDEDRLVLGELECPLHAVRFVGLDLFGLLFAALPVGLFACRWFLRPGDARREDRQRQAQSPGLREWSTFPRGIHERANAPPSTSLPGVHRSPNRLLPSDIDNPPQSCTVIVGELCARETLGL